LPENRTRITQRLVLSGANANSFVAQASIFDQTAPDGMKKLAATIERAHHASRAETRTSTLTDD
jgi:hypothetical protein